MRKFFIKMGVLTLVPCLLTDPSLASGFHSFQKGPSESVHMRGPSRGIFESEAFASGALWQIQSLVSDVSAKIKKHISGPMRAHFQKHAEIYGVGTMLIGAAASMVLFALMASGTMDWDDAQLLRMVSDSMKSAYLAGDMNKLSDLMKDALSYSWTSTDVKRKLSSQIQELLISCGFHKDLNKDMQEVWALALRQEGVEYDDLRLALLKEFIKQHPRIDLAEFLDINLPKMFTKIDWHRDPNAPQILAACKDVFSRYGNIFDFRQTSRDLEKLIREQTLPGPIYSPSPSVTPAVISQALSNALDQFRRRMAEIREQLPSPTFSIGDRELHYEWNGATLDISCWGDHLEISMLSNTISGKPQEFTIKWPAKAPLGSNSVYFSRRSQGKKLEDNAAFEIPGGQFYDFNISQEKGVLWLSLVTPPDQQQFMANTISRMTRAFNGSIRFKVTSTRPPLPPTKWFAAIPLLTMSIPWFKTAFFVGVILLFIVSGGVGWSLRRRNQNLKQKKTIPEPQKPPQLPPLSTTPQPSIEESSHEIPPDDEIMQTNSLPIQLMRILKSPPSVVLNVLFPLSIRTGDFEKDEASGLLGMRLLDKLIALKENKDYDFEIYPYSDGKIFLWNRRDEIWDDAVTVLIQTRLNYWVARAPNDEEKLKISSAPSLPPLELFKVLNIYDFVYPINESTKAGNALTKKGKESTTVVNAKIATAELPTPLPNQVIQSAKVTGLGILLAVILSFILGLAARYLALWPAMPYINPQASDRMAVLVGMISLAVVFPVIQVIRNRRHKQAPEKDRRAEPRSFVQQSA